MKTSPDIATTDSAAIASAGQPKPATPSIHVRALITWMAIFPLVAAGMMASASLMESWHPILRAFALTLVVVPTAVYVVVPRMLRAYGSLALSRNARR